MGGNAPRPRGRPKGSQNKRTLAAKARAELLGLTPLEVMLKDMRDPKLTRAERFAAAVQAAPYMHAKLSSVEARVTDDTPPPLRRVEWVVVRPGEPLPDDEAPADGMGSSRLN